MKLRLISLGETIKLVVVPLALVLLTPGVFIFISIKNFT